MGRDGQMQEKQPRIGSTLNGNLLAFNVGLQDTSLLNAPTN